MKKTIFALIVIASVLIVACEQKQVKETIQTEIEQQTMPAETSSSSDPYTSSMESEMQSADTAEEDLSSDAFSDTDEGLSEVENI